MALWFDTHVHLERYAPHVRATMLARARTAGVGAVLSVSMDGASSRRTAALPDGVYKAVGVHPLRAGVRDSDVVGSLALRRPVGLVAIGEAGFDAAGPDWAAQAAVFRPQCALAREHNLALVLHVDGRGAWESLKA